MPKHLTPKVDFDALINVGKNLLLAIGEDPLRPGIKKTPERFAKWWRSFIEYEPGIITTTFATSRINQVVVVSGMRVWSLCEHHLLPFWCEVSIGYIPKKKVLGLSKFARVAKQHAHRIQIQEQLIHDIADDITLITGSKDVAVVGRGEHLCMTMRGIEMEGLMTTNVMRGAFMKEASARAEFFSIIRMNHQARK